MFSQHHPRSPKPRTRPGRTLGVLTVTVALALSACTGEGTDPRSTSKAQVSSSETTPDPSSTPKPSEGGSGATGAPTTLIPSSGSFVGASVQPEQFTDEGRVTAIESFESAVGRQLDLVHVYSAWTREWPQPADLELMNAGRRLLLSWNGMDMAQIADGSQDALIRQRANEMKAVKAPFWIMFRGEMDRPNLQATVHSPATYIAAWKHTRALFEQAGVTNAAWVWCPTSKGLNEDRAQAYYPGDDVVDWVCADVYPGPTLDPYSSAAKGFTAFTATRDKPAMIGEFGLAERDGRRAAWLTDAAAQVAANSKIKAISYFNGNNDDKGPNAQLNLFGFSDSLKAFNDLLATPHFNPDRLPVGQPDAAILSSP